jgi:hypothetical protein
VRIVNLWEYDDAEFWFADGRLVLRGGNGAGKTKVLELTTLMLLRGEILPSVLDPFGSQHRTMRYNLIPTGEADDPRAPADAGLGYAWAEFGRLDQTGNPVYLICGMGASARRGSGTESPSTWHFVTARRPGKDLALLSGGRALDHKELNKADGVWVPPSAAAYRARLASELFGLTGDSYDSLTELLKQMRRPKLGERLNPASLAKTLRDALPPLATHEITQLAEGWEQLELLRKAVEQTERAATAVARFVAAGWRPWARVMLRRRADGFASATTMLDNTTRAKREADASLQEAKGALHTADASLKATRASRRDSETALRSLLESQAYKDAVASAARVESLRREVQGTDRQVTAAGARRTSADGSVVTARAQVATAREGVGQATGTVGRVSEDLREAAQPAGLEEPARRHLPDRDLESLTAAADLRGERLARLRGLHAEHAVATRQAERSADAVEQAERTLRTASDEEAAASSAVEQAAATLRQAIRAWASSSTVAQPSAAQTETWWDDVAEQTAFDPDDGTVLPSTPVTRLIAAHVQTVRSAWSGRREQARLSRAPIARDHDRTAAELADVRSRVDRSPPAPALWRRRDRPELEESLGAPLWRCVDPAPGVDGEQLACVEAALAASGLLDAWLRPDGGLSAADGTPLLDTFVLSGAAGPPPTRTLLEVLRPSPAGGLPEQAIRDALGRVAWLDHPPSDGDRARFDWLARDGSWQVGRLTGHAGPAGPASFLGAAARAAARERAIGRLEAELDALQAGLDEIDDELDRIETSLRLLDEEQERIPVEAERALGAAVVTLAERGRRRAQCAHDVDELRQQHKSDLTRKDASWASFAEYAAEHRFGLRDLDGQARALDAFIACLRELRGKLEVLAAREEALAAAGITLGQHERALAEASRELSALQEQLRQATLELGAAETVLSLGEREQLQRRQELDAHIDRLNAEIEQLEQELRAATDAVARAETTLTSHEQRRAEAEVARDEAMRLLWEAVEFGLAEPLDVQVPERRNVLAARELATVVRRQVNVSAQASDEDRAWRRCFQSLDALRQQLLPNRDARVVEDEEDGRALQQIAILVDPTSGWQRPQHAADGLAARVREQQDRYDAE